MRRVVGTRRRRFAGFGLGVALAACGPAGCGREASAPAPSAAVPAPEVRRPVILVGLDGADWQLLDAYLAAGAMPELARLVAGGRQGVLRSLDPPLSPLVWTTMVTGVSPLVHRVLDFTRFDPATGARVPVGSADRAVPALWTIAGAAGRSPAVFGLWATWPAEPVAGLIVADRFVARGAGTQPPAGSVHPPEREAWARDTWDRAAAVDAAALRAYLPDLTDAEVRAAAAAAEPLAGPVSGLRQVLVETRGIHALATAWLAAERPDLTIVYVQGTDLAGHLFAPYLPPPQPGTAPADAARFAGVAAAYFREVDHLLGDYRRIAEARGAALAVVSDHGFHWGEGRPAALASRDAATAGRWHREEGIYVLWGAGVAPRPGRERGEVAQVCATVLALLGLPPGEGLAGPPLAGIDPGTRPAVDYAGRIRPAVRPGPGSPGAAAAPGGEDEAVARLRALGYLGAREPAAAPRRPGDTGDPTRTPGSFNNEGLLLAAAGRAGEAEAAFARALALDPGYASPRWNLSDLLFRAGREPERADRLLVEALAAGLPDGARLAVARSAARRREGRAAAADELVEAALAVRPEAPELLLLRGRGRLEAGDCRGAAADFRRAVAGAPGAALAQASLGLALACAGDRAGARAALERALALDPAQPEVSRLLSSLPPA